MRHLTDKRLFALAVALGALPLWVTRHLPMVDLPQHLHLISALHRLDDPTTLYPQLLAPRPGFTPYLGYYHAVSLLNWLLPLELANRVFLTAYVVGLPLSLAFLLRSVGRPTWPALLAVPLAYGDSFGWGFVNYLAALPLGFVTCGLFVRAVEDAPRRPRWAALLALALLGVLAFHVQVFLWLAAALPFLLLTSPAPEDAAGAPGARVRARAWALAGVTPGVALFLAWALRRMAEPLDIRPGEPWHAWGPLFSRENLTLKPFAQNLDELPQVLANVLVDGSDRWPVWAVGAVALAALAVGLVRRGELRGGRLARWRLPGLALLTLALFFLTPFDVRGFVYAFNTRYAQPFAALLVASVPVLEVRWRRGFALAALGCALLTAAVLGRGLHAFGEEAAREWEPLMAATAARPRVMGLIWNTASRVVRFPVYLHSAAQLARAGGGVCNFSFALTPHSPLRYRGTPPPTFPSEWRPNQFDARTQGAAYDHFLVRGVRPERALPPELLGELELLGRAGDAWLLRRR